MSKRLRDEVDHWRRACVALEQENERLRKQVCTEADAHQTTARLAIDAERCLRNRITALEGALRTYGVHGNDCPYPHPDVDGYGPCDCGLNAVLFPEPDAGADEPPILSPAEKDALLAPTRCQCPDDLKVPVRDEKGNKVCDVCEMEIVADEDDDEPPADEGEVCEYARSDMTPCVIKDGECAQADDGACVGCGRFVTAPQTSEQDTAKQEPADSTETRRLPGERTIENDRGEYVLLQPGWKGISIPPSDGGLALWEAAVELERRKDEAWTSWNQCRNREILLRKVAEAAEYFRDYDVSDSALTDALDAARKGGAIE